MYRIADAENRSPLGWAAITFALCIACAMLLRVPLLAEALGFVVAFMAMMIAKMTARA